MTRLGWTAIALYTLGIILITSFVYGKFFVHKQVIVPATTYIESSQVKTLKSEIAELRNELGAKPVVTGNMSPVCQTGLPTDYQSVLHDTVTVYPVGSYKQEHKTHFDLPERGDGQARALNLQAGTKLSLNVNTIDYNYMYVNPEDEKFYHSDSLQVWLSDVMITTEQESDGQARAHNLRPKFIRVISGISPYVNYNKDSKHLELDNVSFDLGFRFFDKYDIEITGSTNMIYGLRLGTRL